MKLKRTTLFALIFCAFALTACGGSGGNNNTDSENVVPENILDTVFAAPASGVYSSEDAKNATICSDEFGDGAHILDFQQLKDRVAEGNASERLQEFYEGAGIAPFGDEDWNEIYFVTYQGNHFVALEDHHYFLTRWDDPNNKPGNYQVWNGINDNEVTLGEDGLNPPTGEMPTGKVLCTKAVME
jgi:hypothetical protein